MLGEPYIKKSGFWADGINGFLLRYPYREPAPEPTVEVQPEHPDFPTGTKVSIKVYFRGNLNGSTGVVSRYYPEASSGPVVGVRVSGPEFQDKEYVFNPYELTRLED